MNDKVPVGFFHVNYRHEFAGARVGKQHVDLAIMRRDFRHHGLDAFALGLIKHECLRPLVVHRGLVAQRDGFLGNFRFAVGDSHHCATRRQLHASTLTEAAAAARD